MPVRRVKDQYLQGCQRKMVTENTPPQSLNKMVKDENVQSLKVRRTKIVPDINVAKKKKKKKNKIS